MKGILLWGASVLFGLRVMAQLVQWLAPQGYLPSFSQFHGAVLPYPVLLGLQLLLLGLMLFLNVRVRSGWRPRSRFAPWLLAFGAVYFAVMLLRLAAGVFDWVAHEWFHRPIPAFFHLVLAVYVITLGIVAKNSDGESMIRQSARLLAYPVTFLLAITLFAGLAPYAPLAVRTYAAVFLGIGVIVLLERVLTFQNAWRPSWQEFADDAGYALIVQVMLPRVLAISVALLLAGQIKYATAFWPHEWHIVPQVILMLLLADFMRYWLHRASHTWPLLWRLHEVHHSVRRLYWLNTSRFHPLEKAVQFLFDALPFILLGVSENVIAAYFVFYAINGFYQHSNVDVRLGLLNYVVSGPELHRWHHSKTISESNANYGNNLIIWDTIFGTRFLPRDRSVEQLGIHRERYPERFFGQLFVPFRRQD